MGGVEANLMEQKAADLERQREEALRRYQEADRQGARKAEGNASTLLTGTRESAVGTTLLVGKS